MAEKRHLCTKCRKKRKEKFLTIVRDASKPGSKVWICKDGCLDGRMNHEARSFLQDKLSFPTEVQSRRSMRQSNEDLAKAVVPGGKYILDVCCGSRAFWFDKDHKHVIFADINPEVADVVMDFRNIKYQDKSFRLVYFDPPHLFPKSGVHSWINKKYGSLSKDNWPNDIRQGFLECWRVLVDFGILIFKWSEGDISVSTVLSLLPEFPLVGHTSDNKNRTHWLSFMKIPEGDLNS